MDSYKTLIVNLKILGELDTGMKLDTRGKFFKIDNMSMYQGILRSWNCQNRTMTYEKISLLIRDINELIKTTDPLTIGYSNKEEWLSYLKPIIEKAITGLANLKVTYESDETFIAQISVEIEMLEKLKSSNSFFRSS